MKDLLKRGFDLNMVSIKKLTVGAGSNTYDVVCDTGRKILKNPSVSEINAPEREPALCEHMLNKGLPVTEFIKSTNGSCIYVDNGNIYHCQKFVEGTNYGVNEAPEWLLPEMAKMLGRIHAALSDYEKLPDGIGEGFFKYMTPDNAVVSYKESLDRAKELNDLQSADELLERIAIVCRMKVRTIDVNQLTRMNTHGDYFISQLICGEDKINAVIDWTSACTHPIVWEIFRSLIYAKPECATGEIDTGALIRYVDSYLEAGRLTINDIKLMPHVYFYQIATCDYYRQYYFSTAANRHIYLDQARFATKVMRYLDSHIADMESELVNYYVKNL